jgi:hypothetical protein
MDSAISTAAPDAEPDTADRTRRRGPAVWFAVLLLLVPTVVAASRAADTDAVTPIPQLLAFLPWLLLPAGAALILALLARWRFGIAWAAVVLAVTGWFVRPYDTGLAEDPPGPVVADLKVLTSNVEFGNGTEGLLTAIKREKPDLVFVQECATPRASRRPITRTAMSSRASSPSVRRSSASTRSATPPVSDPRWRCPARSR